MPTHKTGFVVAFSGRTTVRLRGGQRPCDHCAAKHRHPGGHRCARRSGHWGRNSHWLDHRFKVLTAVEQVSRHRWFNEHGECINDYLAPNDDERDLSARRAVLRTGIDAAGTSDDDHRRMRDGRRHRYGHHLERVGGSGGGQGTGTLNVGMMNVPAIVVVFNDVNGVFQDVSITPSKDVSTTPTVPKKKTSRTAPTTGLATTTTTGGPSPVVATKPGSDWGAD